MKTPSPNKYFSSIDVLRAQSNYLNGGVNIPKPIIGKANRDCILLPKDMTLPGPTAYNNI